MCQSIFRFKRRKNISTGETAALGWWESPVPETGIELHNYLSDWWVGDFNSKSRTLNAEVRVHSFTTRARPNRKNRAEHLTSASPFSLHPSIYPPVHASSVHHLSIHPSSTICHPSIYLFICPSIFHSASIHPSSIHPFSTHHLSIHPPQVHPHIYLKALIHVKHVKHLKESFS